MLYISLGAQDLQKNSSIYTRTCMNVETVMKLKVEVMQIMVEYNAYKYQ